MTFSYSDINDNSIPVALKIGGYINNEKILYFNKENGKGSSEISISDGSFVPLPDVHKKASAWLLAGPKGSGKTTLARQICEGYKVVYPSNKIVLFSQNYNQELWNTLKGIEVMRLDSSIVEKPIVLEELKDSLVVFDDIHTLPDVKISEGKKIKTYNLSKIVLGIRDNILQNGRHQNISCISITHMLTNYAESRKVLEESDYIVWYRVTGPTHVKRLLINYAGFTKELTKKIMRLPSRWTLLCREHQYVLTSNEALAISREDSDDEDNRQNIQSMISDRLVKFDEMQLPFYGRGF